MKAAIFNGKGKIELGERPDPKIQEPTDAVVRVISGCVCGSDLWYYRGASPHDEGAIGHEFIGIIEEVGSGITKLKNGDFVIAPFTYCDGTCANCLAGWPSNCMHGGGFGNHGIDGGQGEFVRVPSADPTLVRIPGSGFSDETLASLLALSDVMCTGHHAAVSGGVKKGDTVAVVGDSAVGLCAIIVAKRLGGGSLYHAIKWGIEGFVESVAQEVVPFGIGMTIVEPRGARTEFRYGSAQVAQFLPVYD